MNKPSFSADIFQRNYQAFKKKVTKVSFQHDDFHLLFL